MSAILFTYRFFVLLFRYISIKKIKNYVSLYTSYLLKREIKCQSPAFISVEPCNFCQLHCPECPVGMGVIPKKKQFFDTDLFEKIIDELKENLLHVIFYFQGEPLLSKQLTTFISYAHKNGIYTSTSTNAQLLSDDLARQIVLSGLDKIIVSMDGTTQDIYEKYRRGGDLNKALQGIDNIVKWKKTLKSITPLVEIQFLVLKTNEHQMADMKTLFEQTGADRLRFKTAQLYEFENGHELLPTHQRYSRYKQGEDGKFYLKSTLPNRCRRLWSGAVVNTDGDVLPCCFDKTASFAFGNVRETSFLACWHSDKARNFRKKLLENRRQFEMCRNCTGK